MTFPSSMYLSSIQSLRADTCFQWNNFYLAVVEPLDTNTLHITKQTCMFS